MEISNNPVKHEVRIKQYLRSILDISGNKSKNNNLHWRYCLVVLHHLNDLVVSYSTDDFMKNYDTFQFGKHVTVSTSVLESIATNQKSGRVRMCISLLNLTQEKIMDVFAMYHLDKRAFLE